MRRMLTLALCAVLALGLLVAAAGCGGDEQSKQFKVGLECGYPPFNWTQADDSNGAVPIAGTNQYAGVTMLKLRRIAEGLGRELVVKTSWKACRLQCKRELLTPSLPACHPPPSGN